MGRVELSNIIVYANKIHYMDYYYGNKIPWLFTRIPTKKKEEDIIPLPKAIATELKFILDVLHQTTNLRNWTLLPQA